MAWAAAIAILAIGISFLINRRTAFFLVGAIAAIAVVLILATALNKTVDGGRMDAVNARAAGDAAACPDPARPILVELENQSEQAVQQVSFALIGKLKGHSSISFRGFLRNDKIIEAGGRSRTCYGLLPLGFTSPRPETVVPDNYDWTVEVSLVDFK